MSHSNGEKKCPGAGPWLILHEPVYFKPGQIRNCRSAGPTPKDSGRSAESLPHAAVVMCRCCGRRGIEVEPEYEDAYLAGKYSKVILDARKPVTAVEKALRELGD